MSAIIPVGLLIVFWLWLKDRVAHGFVLVRMWLLYASRRALPAHDTPKSGKPSHSVTWHPGVLQ